jgi:hypothetical protein
MLAEVQVFSASATAATALLCDPATLTGCRPRTLEHCLAYLTKMGTITDLAIAKAIGNVHRFTIVTFDKALRMILCRAAKLNLTTKIDEAVYPWKNTE